MNDKDKQALIDFLDITWSDDNPDNKDTVDFINNWNWVMMVWIKFRSLDINDETYISWIGSLQWYLFNSNEPIRFSERLVHAINWYNGYVGTVKQQ